MTAGRRPEPIGILILSMAELHAFWAEITTFSPVSLVAGPSLRQSTQILMCAFMRSCDPCRSPSLLQTCSVSVLEVYLGIVLRCPGYSNGNAKLRYHTHECKQHMSLSKTAASSRFDGPRTCQAPLITQVNIRQPRHRLQAIATKQRKQVPFEPKFATTLPKMSFEAPDAFLPPPRKSLSQTPTMRLLLPATCFKSIMSGPTYDCCKLCLLTTPSSSYSSSNKFDVVTATLPNNALRRHTALPPPPSKINFRCTSG